VGKLSLRRTPENLVVDRSRRLGIFESIDDSIVSTDVKLRITAFNRAAEDLTGLRAADVLGKPCWEILHPVDQNGSNCCSTRCPRLLTSSAPHRATTQESIRGADGRAATVLMTRLSIRGNEGKPCGVVHLMRDVNAEMDKGRKRDEYLSMVSHELRTPLGHIKGYATTLLAPGCAWEESVVRHCLETIVEAADELQVLVENVLDMSMIGAKLLDIQLVPKPLASLVRTTVLRLSGGLSGRTVDVHISDSLPLVLVDPQRVGQVLYNLLDNAVKYSPGGRQITIAAEEVGRQVRVSIADDGIGIPPSDRVRIFQPFHRGAMARRRNIGGSGLGLSICKGIVEAHGGQIWAESPAPGHSPGRPPGTIVFFTLPTSTLAAGGDPRSIDEPEQPGPRRSNAT
jgi:PAS domain S-box-containing protein